MSATLPALILHGVNFLMCYECRLPYDDKMSKLIPLPCYHIHLCTIRLAQDISIVLINPVYNLILLEMTAPGKIKYHRAQFIIHT